MNNPEFTAVILAATPGNKLYPLTVSGDDEFDNFFDDQSQESQNSSNNQGSQHDDKMEKVTAEVAATQIDTAASTNAAGTAADDNEEKKKNEDDEHHYLPKHLLPLAGKPIIQHLIEKLIGASFKHVIIAISSQDGVTIPSLISMGAVAVATLDAMKEKSEEKKEEEKGENDKTVQMFQIGNNTLLKVVQLSSDCGGSADALRFISSVSVQQPCSGNVSNVDSDGNNQYESIPIIPNGSHVMVMSADLVLYGNLCIGQDDKNVGSTNGSSDVLGTLADVHRRHFRLGMIGKGNPLALTLLLADVGETDENGVPLKESAKAKKGGMSREDEDIEYIGLSEIPTSISTAQRIILKQNKFNVEEDEDNTGQTPKLNIPKARLHAPINQILIRTDWNDVHLFCFSPWVLKLIGSKVHLKDLSKEVLPLLVESQFKGVKACLGIQNVDCDQDKMTSNGTSTGAGSGNDEQNGDLNGKLNIWEQIKSQPPFNHRSVDDTGASSYGDDEDKASEPSDYPFTVLAHTLTHEESKLVLRASSVPSYVYACREVVSQAIKISSPANVPPSSFPKGATVDTKFNSIILENSSLGEKVQIKSSTIGKNVTVGNRCRLNNVVVMDDVTIGENCILQNSVLSKGCKLGDNCNLNDCQLGPQCSLPKGTRGKGESYLKDGE